MKWSGKKFFSFDRLEVEHLCAIIRLAQEHGHSDCGFCASFLSRFEESLRKNGVGAVKKVRLMEVG